MKFNKIFSVVAGLGLLCGAYSCTDKIEPTPSPVIGNAEVYFPYTDDQQISIPVDATMITLNINRVDDSEDITVPLTSKVTYVDDTDADNPVTVDVTDIFTIPTSVTFPKGVKQMALEIGVDFSKVVMDRSYNLDMTIDAAYVGDYGLSHRVFEAIYLPWTDWMLLSETDPGIYQQGALWDYEYENPCYYRQSLIDEKLSQYIVFSPFSDFDYDEIITLNRNDSILVDGTYCYKASLVEPIFTPVVNTNYGETMNYTTTVEYLTTDLSKVGFGGPYTEAQVPAVIDYYGLHYSYFNPVQGRFYLYMSVFTDSYYFGDFLETYQLPGDYKDYYFTFNYAGNMVTPKGQEYAMVQVVPSPDVDHYVCEILSGKLSEDALQTAYESLANDPDAEYIYDASYTMQYMFEQPGQYTVIAVGYNAANEVVCNGSEVYTFESVQKESNFETIGVCDYTDGIFIGLFWAGSMITTWEVELQEHKEIKGFYRLVNPYEEWPWIADLASYGWTLTSGNHYIELDTTDPDFVLMPDNELGVYIDEEVDSKDPSAGVFGAVSACDFGWYYINYGGNDPAKVKANGYGGKLEDDMITFTRRGLLLFTEQGDGFYANIDPDNSKLTTGPGVFCVDLAPALGIKGKKTQPKVKLPSLASLKHAVEAKEKAQAKKTQRNFYTKKEASQMLVAKKRK